jgi:hypothetical protein
MLAWYLSSVEMSLWAVSGPPHTVRKWETDEIDFHHLAEELAQFTAGLARNRRDGPCP